MPPPVETQVVNFRLPGMFGYLSTGCLWDSYFRHADMTSTNSALSALLHAKLWLALLKARYFG